MRYISTLLFIVVCAFTIVACDCRDDESSTGTSQDTSTLTQEKKEPLFHRLKLQTFRKNIKANSCDNARIFISLRDGWGKIIKKAHHKVKLEIVAGEGVLSDTHPKLEHGRTRVSITSGTAGEIVILAKYKLKNGKNITQSLVIEAIEDDDDDHDSNSAPEADAGKEQTVSTGAVVTLDGSNSQDADQDDLTYKWTIVELPNGSSAALSDATDVNPTFTADMEGSYAIQLVVNDGDVDSTPDTVMITVDGNDGNSAPIADAGPDQQVSTGTTVVLDGSESSDEDDDVLSYDWTITDAPQGSDATLSDETVAAPTFTADMDGTYVIQLIVDDGTVDSEPDTVTITAASGSGNSAPTADAGADQEVSTGTTVMLDGSESSDADDDSLSYAWTIVESPQSSDSVLSDPTTSATVFFTPDVDGEYTIQLIVNDGSVDSEPDTVTITATSSGPDGEALYNQYCQSCHGDDGTNNGDLSNMTAATLMSMLPHYGVESDDIGGQEGAEAISDYITE